MSIQRERMDVDVLIVGAGPAGLGAAIRLKQLRPELDVCVLEKAAEVGAHTLSGAVMDTRALDELFPNWKEKGAPLDTQVTEDDFAFLTEAGRFSVPNALLPKTFTSPGCYVGSLGRLVAWLGEQAEALEVQVFPGFAAASLMIESGRVAGVVTGDLGLDASGQPGPNFEPGMELAARYTLFAEGCRGHLGRELEEEFNLRENADPQTYALGFKEVWKIPKDRHKPGLVSHTAGYPLDAKTYGGSFLYHYGEDLVSVGFVVGLGYENPYLSPFEEFQRWKQHPSVASLLDGAERLSFGARTIAAGGLQSLPKLTFPGGALIGCEAGFLNAARIKGSHTALKSGMLAAESIAHNWNTQSAELECFAKRVEDSWIHRELHQSRNFKPYMSKGLWAGSVLFGIDQLVFRGKAPWTLRNKADHSQLRPKSGFAPIDYPKPDGKITFDRLSSVYLSNTNHAEEQPCHLTLKDAQVAIKTNFERYASPETRYCPAGVYEIVEEAGNPRLQINSQNCVHCKACDIKDPTQNIVWKTPQGGEGPIYQGM